MSWWLLLPAFCLGWWWRGVFARRHLDLLRGMVMTLQGTVSKLRAELAETRLRHLVDSIWDAPDDEVAP